jgi:hypothetical protein
MKIIVTATDIKKGRASAARFNIASITCPVARAIKRVVKGKNYGIIVGPDAVSVRKNKGWTVLDLPKKATLFINAFDTLKPVSPFSFNLKGL